MAVKAQELFSYLYNMVIKKDPNKQNPEEDFLLDPYGRRVVVPLRGTEVVGDFEPRDEDEAKVYENLGLEGVMRLREIKGAVRGGRDELASSVMGAGLEAARFLPIVGEGIDAAELATAFKTGDDLYGREVDPKLLAGLTAAGYLIPNIIERPARAVAKAVKSGLGTAKKNIGEGVRAMKSLPKDISYQELVKMPVVYDPEAAIMAGRKFTERFYSDPYVQKHFTDLYGAADEGIGALPKTFQRGSSPAPVQPNPMRGRYEGAAGVFDPATDEVFIDEYFFNPRLRDQRNPAMAERVTNIVTHELGHYANDPLFYYRGSGEQMIDNIEKSIKSVMPSEFFQNLGPMISRGTNDPDMIRASRKYWSYLSDPVEVTARAQEIRRLMEDFIFNKNTDQSLFKSIGDDESFSKLMIGDFSELNDKEVKILFENVFENADDPVQHFTDYVLKGGAGKINTEKIKSISDVLKYALMVPAAGVAATQVEMIDGGKLKLLKKK